MSQKVLVVGASENPSRYSNKAIIKLNENGYKVFAFGNRPGEVMGTEIVTEFPKTEMDTLTLYLGSKNQKPNLIKIRFLLLQHQDYQLS